MLVLKFLAAVAIAIGLVFGYIHLHGSSPDPYKFGNQAAFEARVQRGFVSLTKSQNNVDVKDVKAKCIKTGLRSADCAVTGRDSLGKFTAEATVNCQTTDGQDCLLKAETINHS